MKNYFKKTTTNTQQHQKIRKDLVNFVTKLLGKKINHLRKVHKNNTINDATFVIFAKGRVTTLQDSKVYVIDEHNGPMAFDDTLTVTLTLWRTKLKIKTLKYNPLIRTVIIKEQKNV